MVPGAVGATTTVTVAKPPLGTSPNGHKTSLKSLTWQEPWLGVAETIVASGDRKSLRPTCWVEESFDTVSVTVSGSPTVAGSGENVWVTLIDARLCLCLNRAC